MKLANRLGASIVLTATALSTTAQLAQAAPVAVVDQVSYGGSGCPADSISVGVSANGQKLTFGFDQFRAAGNRAAQSRKSCQISLAIQVPAGYQIALSGADYQGYVARNTTAALRSEYFFAGQRGPVFLRNIKGETRYSVRDRLTDVWSACGESVNMRVNSSIVAKGAGRATVERGLGYQIKYRACR
jgi:Domain of unknown function (DUF4360)